MAESTEDSRCLPQADAQVSVPALVLDYQPADRRPGQRAFALAVAIQTASIAGLLAVLICCPAGFELGLVVGVALLGAAFAMMTIWLFINAHYWAGAAFLAIPLELGLLVAGLLIGGLVLGAALFVPAWLAGLQPCIRGHRKDPSPGWSAVARGFHIVALMVALVLWAGWGWR
jgi:hypothetical protein